MTEDFMEIDGRRVHFFRRGGGARKFIILHGWDQNIDAAASFEPLITALFENKNFAQNFEIILPEFPGFGRSEMPPKTGFSAHDYEKWLEMFLEKIDTKNAVFFSHSFGGRVLSRFLAANQNATEYAFLCASAGIKWPLSWRQKISIFLSKKFARAKNILPRKIQKFILNKIFGARDWGAVKPELKPTLERVLAEPDFRGILPEISAPVTVFWGEKDSVTPLKSGKIFAEKIPNAEFVVFPNGRHGIHRTHAHKIAERIFRDLKME